MYLLVSAILGVVFYFFIFNINTKLLPREIAKKNNVYLLFSLLPITIIFIVSAICYVYINSFGYSSCSSSYGCSYSSHDQQLLYEAYRFLSTSIIYTSLYTLPILFFISFSLPKLWVKYTDSKLVKAYYVVAVCYATLIGYFCYLIQPNLYNIGSMSIITLSLLFLFLVVVIVLAILLITMLIFISTKSFTTKEIENKDYKKISRIFSFVFFIAFVIGNIISNYFAFNTDTYGLEYLLSSTFYTKAIIILVLPLFFISFFSFYRIKKAFLLCMLLGVIKTYIQMYLNFYYEISIEIYYISIFADLLLNILIIVSIFRISFAFYLGISLAFVISVFILLFANVVAFSGIAFGIYGIISLIICITGDKYIRQLD
ncbi:hypothetical protein ACFPDQ_03305 [Pseudofrancisella aestuarii]|uniref:Uncharacterized protein n=1 Tax=Pseudofrancisella aestuarii TaxID=2670347 RepID=A0ABV9TCR6_9GAMM|nr:hypothetical protein [Pseudofrancisella aestuarii]